MESSQGAAEISLHDMNTGNQRSPRCHYCDTLAGRGVGGGGGVVAGGRGGTVAGRILMLVKCRIIVTECECTDNDKNMTASM